MESFNKPLQRQSFGSFSIPLSWQSRSNSFLLSPIWLQDPKRMKGTCILSFQLSSPAAILLPPAGQHQGPCNALPFNSCPWWGCTDMTNCNLQNTSTLPRHWAPACSTSNVSALQGQKHQTFPLQCRAGHKAQIYQSWYTVSFREQNAAKDYEISRNKSSLSGLNSFLRGVFLSS